VGHVFVAFTFDNEGRFEGHGLVTLATTETYERVRSRFQTDAASFDQPVGGLSYIGGDGNLWLFDPASDEQEPLIQQSDGRIIAHDWSSENGRVVYVTELADESKASFIESGVPRLRSQPAG
jgi:hypothetical protein